MSKSVSIQEAEGTVVITVQPDTSDEQWHTALAVSGLLDVYYTMIDYSIDEVTGVETFTIKEAVDE